MSYSFKTKSPLLRVLQTYPRLLYNIVSYLYPSIPNGNLQLYRLTITCKTIRKVILDGINRQGMGVIYQMSNSNNIPNKLIDRLNDVTKDIIVWEICQNRSIQLEESNINMLVSGRYVGSNKYVSQSYQQGNIGCWFWLQVNYIYFYSSQILLQHRQPFHSHITHILVSIMTLHLHYQPLKQSNAMNNTFNSSFNSTNTNNNPNNRATLMSYSMYISQLKEQSINTNSSKVQKLIDRYNNITLTNSNSQSDSISTYMSQMGDYINRVVCMTYHRKYSYPYLMDVQGVLVRKGFRSNTNQLTNNIILPIILNMNLVQILPIQITNNVNIISDTNNINSCILPKMNNKLQWYHYDYSKQFIIFQLEEILQVLMSKRINNNKGQEQLFYQNSIRMDIASNGSCIRIRAIVKPNNINNHTVLYLLNHKIRILNYNTNNNNNTPIIRLKRKGNHQNNAKIIDLCPLDQFIVYLEKW